MRRNLPCLVFTAVALIGADGAGAQTVRGILSEAESGRPVPRAFMVLEDSTGVAVSTALTGPPGTWLLRAPAAGRYRVRADRIGYEAVFSDYFRLGVAETVTRALTTPPAPIDLSSIEVTGTERCQMLREESLAIHRVWEEARKALAAIAWTGQQPYFRFDAVHFRRTLDPAGTPIRPVEYEEVRYFGRHPFRSIPTRDLLLGGFVQQIAGSLRYYGPDAEVLLSTEFLRRHCFRLVEDAAAERIGLAFEPLEDVRVTDISGTMWLDPGTAELNRLDFRYENLQLAVDTRGLGGHVDFARLPSGAWIVRSWSIRAPVIGPGPPRRSLRGRDPPHRRLVSIDEGGGHVTAVYVTSRLAGLPSTDTLPVRPPADSLIARFPLPE